MKVLALIAAFLPLFLSSNGSHGQVVAAGNTGADLKAFAAQIVGNESSNFRKAEKILNHLGNNFEWKATDYQTRTVEQIFTQQGGNCFELAKLYMALIQEAGIHFRPVAEINIHKADPERGKRAAELVREKGKGASVFGKQHNDHRWVEIYDNESGLWIPADPTMNVIGTESWLKARAWFGERKTINEEIARDMIVPFAVFVVDRENKKQMLEDRTRYYLIEKLDQLYGNRLSKLPSWRAWVTGLERLTDHARAAFAGKENLHDYNEAIQSLAKTYQQLKKEYEAAS